MIFFFSLSFFSLKSFCQHLTDHAVSALTTETRNRERSGGAAAGLQQLASAGLSQVRSPPGVAASPGSTGGATTGVAEEADDGGMLSGACDLLLLSTAAAPPAQPLSDQQQLPAPPQPPSSGSFHYLLAAVTVPQYEIS